MLLVLAVPFIPVRFHIPAPVLIWLNSFRTIGGNAAAHGFMDTGGLNGNSGDWLRDFSVSVSRQAPMQFYQILLLVWIIGVLFMAAVTIRSGMRVNRIRRASLPLQNRELKRLFDSCNQELNIDREIPILSSQSI